MLSMLIMFCSSTDKKEYSCEDIQPLGAGPLWCYVTRRSLTSSMTLVEEHQAFSGQHKTPL